MMLSQKFGYERYVTVRVESHTVIHGKEDCKLVSHEGKGKCRKTCSYCCMERWRVIAVGKTCCY